MESLRGAKIREARRKVEEKARGLKDGLLIIQVGRKRPRKYRCRKHGKIGGRGSEGIGGKESERSSGWCHEAP